jgi:hypothetical protein
MTIWTAILCYVFFLCGFFAACLLRANNDDPKPPKGWRDEDTWLR